MTTTTRTDIDPIDLEIFSHRLWAIGEEGRIALQRVTASPIVAQGGECMCSFYDADGAMILACSGHLRFAAATSDAIRHLVDRFGDDPGIGDGDEFVVNDPYIAGSHTYDIMQIAPVFWEGERVAWVASSSHTADTGGILRGTATEIFHEGIRLQGLKIVEAGRFRNDVFVSIVEQCRDPHYVGMDLKSRTAANNVAIRGYLGLIERFGIDFVAAAGRRLIEDAEAMARARLVSIPDGTWRSRIYGSARDPGSPKPVLYQVLCTATKTGDELTLDFTGSSGQLASDQNSTLPSTLAHVAIALTNQLFWDVPWSDGRMAPVRVIVPEGTALHCRFPAACSRSPRIGQYVVEAVRDCLAKMLYAAGRREEVNASWGSFWYLGGPGFFYGGHGPQGLPVPQGLYDIHGGGLGAAPTRDGVPSGGQANIPSGGISDVERIELQYPFLYLGRNHLADGGGAGRWSGGTGTSRLALVHGSSDLSADLVPYAGMPHGASGLFGGYPSGIGGIRALLEPADDLPARLASAKAPSTATEALADGSASIALPGGSGRARIPEGWLVSDFTQGGGGFGDPLDREPERVARDVRTHVVSERAAQWLHGVLLDDAGDVDGPATLAERDRIRAERLGGRAPERPARALEDVEDGAGTQGAATREAATREAGGTAALRFHPALEIRHEGVAATIVCVRCETGLGPATGDYKRTAARRDRDLADLAGRPMPDESPYVAVLREYACPGCATLLAVDVWCEALGGDEDLADIAISVGSR